MGVPIPMECRFQTLNSESGLGWYLRVKGFRLDGLEFPSSSEQIATFEVLLSSHLRRCSRLYRWNDFGSDLEEHAP